MNTESSDTLMGQAKTKIIEMFGLVSEMSQDAFSALQQSSIKLVDIVLKKEQKVNDFEKEITLLLVDLSKQSLKTKESDRVKNLLLITSNVERIGDHLEQIVERIEIKVREELTFSSQAQNEINNLFQTANELIADSVKVLGNNDSSLAKKLLEKKPGIDKLVDEYKNHHVERLTKGICDYRSGMVFSDIVGILGGICKHSCSVVEMWMS